MGGQRIDHDHPTVDPTGGRNDGSVGGPGRGSARIGAGEDRHHGDGGPRHGVGHIIDRLANPLADEREGLSDVVVACLDDHQPGVQAAELQAVDQPGDRPSGVEPGPHVAGPRYPVDHHSPVEPVGQQIGPGLGMALGAHAGGEGRTGHDEQRGTRRARRGPRRLLEGGGHHCEAEEQRSREWKEGASEAAEPHDVSVWLDPGGGVGRPRGRPKCRKESPEKGNAL
jgi:hypothetical protein